jgi:polynucleotide 5'-kinase involved in rRNA processing
MISAFKRLVNPSASTSPPAAAAATSDPNNNVASLSSANGGAPPTGHQTAETVNGHHNMIPQQLSNGMQMLQHSLQKKFARGVNYNMKIVIRGDYNTGKSTLWHRYINKKNNRS